MLQLPQSPLRTAMSETTAISSGKRSRAGLVLFAAKLCCRGLCSLTAEAARNIGSKMFPLTCAHHMFCKGLGPSLCRERVLSLVDSAPNLPDFAFLGHVGIPNRDRATPNLHHPSSMNRQKKRSPAKGVWQKSDEKSDRSVRKSGQT